MIARDRDPAGLTAQERLSEIARLLARGYLRLRTSQHAATRGASSAGKALALGGDVEAQCGAPPHNPESGGTQ